MKRLLALILALLCLTSCAAMLEREYTEAADHIEDQPPVANAAYRAETYPALKAAMRSYMEEGMARGALRCPTTYPGNLSVDLEKAKRQLMEEDPLGSYALEDVSFRTSRIIAYYEVELDFTYKVDRRSLTSLPKAASQEALADLLRQALERRETQVAVYLTLYPESDDRFFSDALDLALDPDGGEGEPGLDLPEEAGLTAVELYPKEGSRRVAVLELEYPLEQPQPTGEEVAGS